MPKSGLACTFHLIRAAGFLCSTSYRRLGVMTRLPFDHFTEAVRFLGVLALQVFAGGVEFRWIGVLHDQGR